MLRRRKADVESELPGRTIKTYFVPMAEEQGPKGSEPAQRQKFVYDTAEANVPAPPGSFAFPDTEPKKVAEVRQ